MVDRLAIVAARWLKTKFRKARSVNPHLHFAFFFKITVIYAAYRVVSRPIFAYGALDSSSLTYPRPYTRFFPVQIHELFSGAWIHKIWWPSATFLSFLQLAILVLCFIAILGALPRFSSLAIFLGLLYQTSLMQATNSEIDGGTMVLALLLWFSLQEKGFVRALWRRSVSTERAVSTALVGAQMIVGAFYFYSGVNKLVDVGIDFPFRLSLQNLAEERRYEILFDGARLGVDWLLVLMESSSLSVLGGGVTLVAELLLLPALLFFRSLRVPAVSGLILLHTLVLFSAGINFIGSSILLLTTLDISRFFRNRSESREG